MDDVGSKLPQRPINDITRDIHGLHTRPSGCGGQSDVYSAFWSSEYGYLPVAVKVLRFAGDPDERIRKRLDSEISLWGRVSHPNLQRLLGVCYVPTSALPAMVSEWHPNGDVTAYLKTKAQDTELQEIKYRLLIAVLEGVEYLHENGILHGDIKGANVLISNDGSARLSDFGFSIISTEHSRSLSQRSGAKGTTRWMAPEFFDENDRVAIHTRASDVWAIGCLIIEVQTGDLPYGTKRSDPAVILAIVKGEPPALQPFKPDVLWRLTLYCCQVQPSARHTPSQLLSSLRIQRLTSLLLRGRHDPNFWDLALNRAAILDIATHLHNCKLSHSPIPSLVKEALNIIGSNGRWTVGSNLRLIAESACDLLALCVDVAQQPHTVIAIQFLVNTVPSLLPVMEWSEQSLCYPVDAVRPLAKVLAEHCESPLAPLLIRVCVSAPGSFKLAVGDSQSRRYSQALTTWSSNGSLFAIASGASVAITQLGNAPSVTLSLGPSSVTRIAMSPDGQLLACSCVSGLRETLSLWDIRTQCALDIGTSPGDLGLTRDLVFSRDGECFASVNDAGNSDTVYVWRMGHDPIRLATPQRLIHWTVTFTADSRLVVAGTHSQSLRNLTTVSSHDLTTAVLATFREFELVHREPVIVDSEGRCLIDWTGQGRYLITWSSEGRYLIAWNWYSTTIRLYSPLSGQLLCSLTVEEKARINCITSSPDGSHVASGTLDGFVYVWDVETGSLLENSPLPVSRVSIVRLTFTSDGTKIITLAEDGEVCTPDIRGLWLRLDI